MAHVLNLTATDIIKPFRSLMPSQENEISVTPTSRPNAGKRKATESPNGSKRAKIDDFSAALTTIPPPVSLTTLSLLSDVSDDDEDYQDPDDVFEDEHCNNYTDLELDSEEEGEHNSIASAASSHRILRQQDKAFHEAVAKCLRKVSLFPLSLTETDFLACTAHSIQRPITAQTRSSCRTSSAACHPTDSRYCHPMELNL